MATKVVKITAPNGLWVHANPSVHSTNHLFAAQDGAKYAYESEIKDGGTQFYEIDIPDKHYNNELYTHGWVVGRGKSGHVYSVIEPAGPDEGE